ncbi:MULTISPECIES: exodeoxyribonuclease VII small subunit [Legionella]|uniref:Exodeoxyribonuclease 7 small subunit n=1 Tax=Legionella septentrionalis TaxID=2498109 RepID=A0A3S0X5X9_9GAMM|nr:MULTISPECIES: exodeoxyribonuclease VII small subunit [Legionella]MCP0913077.1 exodeoxyribonuclease VII small subunit [Legionella sp. 27cVA30]RUQ91527.1 exodeoxyribonuclease VII small subunit [Legionella septentrionalis]RUQ94999.1 exodeoxyribonuclease VII small subunit [Legionella septentrionalis]RUR10579.1 exodeoxyribonuclease VII small subunit [Legionella septentrionalis]RUR13791.1 exodeoxyribonuclease VII small subunit [Legionella septentrionalis]
MTKTIHFEKTITELEDIVSQLEKGELSLEDSLKQFEKGITLARKCQEILTQAEQKIEMLSSSKTIDNGKADD